MGIDQPANGYQLVAILDRLRDDVREDLVAMERRMTAAIETGNRQLSNYQTEHGQEHLTQRGESIAAHRRFDEFIQSAQLNQARKDGALGILKFVIDLFGRNWKAIAVAAGALLTFAGNVQINLGVR